MRKHEVVVALERDEARAMLRERSRALIKRSFYPQGMPRQFAAIVDAVSLAQPMYIELWERGLGILGEAGGDLSDVAAWIRSLYDAPAPAAQTFDSWLYEAGHPAAASLS